MSWLLWCAGVLLVMSALLVVVRIVRGPTVLDRALGSDVLVSIVVCSVGLDAVAGGHSWTLPVLITLAMLGFVPSVAVARFVGRDTDPRFDDRSDDALAAVHDERSSR